LDTLAVVLVMVLVQVSELLLMVVVQTLLVLQTQAAVEVDKMQMGPQLLDITAVQEELSFVYQVQLQQQVLQVLQLELNLVDIQFTIGLVQEA
jgi:hypothetical protein